MSFDAVSKTALLTAAARAAESARDDALFVDPWAAALAGPAGKAMLDATGSPRPRLALAVRTRFLDDIVNEFVSAASASPTSVVTIASGFDMRPYRCACAGAGAVRWFEIDRAEVLEAKRACLQRERAPERARVDVRALSLDATADFVPALRAAGLDAGEPALFVAEGLMMYLSTDDARVLIARVDAIASRGSVFAFDVPSEIDRSGAMARHHRELDRAGAGWRFSCVRPDTLFDAARWGVEVVHLGHPRAHYGRWPTPASETPPTGAITWLVVARRR